MCPDLFSIWSKIERGFPRIVQAGEGVYNNRTAKSCGFTIDGHTNPGVLLWSGQSDGGTRERYIIENIREEIACTFLSYLAY